MARARNIKPGFFKNELLVEMPVFSRLLFVGLWTLADREGRLEDRPKRIKLELFPYDSEDVEAGLSLLEASAFISRYQVNGFRVIQIVNFLKHQTPHGTEKDSDLPDTFGIITVHERDSKGYVSGRKRANNVNSSANNVNPPLDNSASTVKAPLDNTLNPDSLNPESLILNPDSLNPDTQASPSSVCFAMKSEGLASVNPSHPELTVLIDAGATTEHFKDAAKRAVERGKSFAYAIAIVKGEMSSASDLKKKPLAAPKKSQGTYADRMRDIAAEFTGSKVVDMEVVNVVAITGR